MITSFGDFMQIPFYFHVHQDPIKFYPTIIDFGYIHKNFDLLRMSLKMEIKDKYKDFEIIDIFVPINDERLDFLIIDAKKLQQVRKTYDIIPMGTVFLNPI